MRNITVVGLVTAVLVSFTACDDGTTPPPGNTPAQALRALEDSFKTRDLELLDGLLTVDFTFYFDEDDVGDDIGGYTVPESWGRDDMLAACDNMFNEAYSIDFDVHYESVGDPDDGATEFIAYNVNIYLLVMVDSTNGYAATGFCDFRFFNVGSGADDNWVISGWWDYTAGMFETTEPTSLGRILAIYR